MDDDTLVGQLGADAAKAQASNSLRISFMFARISASSASRNAASC
jgi:hypothetical protein